MKCYKYLIASAANGIEVDSIMHLAPLGMVFGNMRKYQNLMC